MIIEDEEFLTTWIMKDVASLTDADADRLAMYVIALLKKPLSDEDLVETCLDKLEVFLQSHTKDFVDRLFKCIKEGTYLPEEAQTAEIEDFVFTDSSNQDEDLKNKLSDQLMEEDNKNTLKSNNKDFKDRHSERSLATDSSRITLKADSKTNNPSNKNVRRRISPPSSTSDKDTNRYNRGGRLMSRSPIRMRRNNALSYQSNRGRPDRYHRRRSYSRSRSSCSRSRSRSRSLHRERRRDDHNGERRRRCRDFHEKGFCMRGDKCVYDHGPDPVVIENSALEKIVNRAATTTTSSLYSSPNPPPPGVERVYSAVSEAYNPEAPALTTVANVLDSTAAMGKMDFTVPPPPLPTQIAAVPAVPLSYGSNVASSSALVTVVPNVQSFNSGIPSIGSGSLLPNLSQDSVPAVYNASSNNIPQQNAASTGFNLRRGAFARGRFQPYGAAPRVNPALCSLLVKKIPPEQNKIVLLDQHFGKFGQITNLHVQYEGQPDTALVTFKTRREALNAYKSTEPIFNNRFIKVYWQTQPPEPEVTNNTATNNCAPITETVTNTTNNVDQNKVVDNENRTFSKTFVQGVDSNSIESSNEKSPVKETTKLNAITAAPTLTENNSVNSLTSKRSVYNPRALVFKKKTEKINLSRLFNVHCLKTKLYQKQIEQQKNLLRKIQTTDDRCTKKKYLELVKKTEELMKTAKAELESLNKQITCYQEKQEQQTRCFQALIDENTADEEQRNGENASNKVTKKNSDSFVGSTDSSNVGLNTLHNNKLFRVLHVSGCPPEFQTSLVTHMEKYGYLFDYDCTPSFNNKPCVFAYKSSKDAQQAMKNAEKQCSFAQIKVDWAPVSLGYDQSVVPDSERKSDDQMTPAALLASLEYEEEDEDEGVGINEAVLFENDNKQLDLLELNKKSHEALELNEKNKKKFGNN